MVLFCSEKYKINLEIQYKYNNNVSKRIIGFLLYKSFLFTLKFHFYPVPDIKFKTWIFHYYFNE